MFIAREFTIKKSWIKIAPHTIYIATISEPDDEIDRTKSETVM